METLEKEIPKKLKKTEIPKTALYQWGFLVASIQLIHFPGLRIINQTQLRDRRVFTSVFNKDPLVQQFVKVEKAKMYTQYAVYTIVQT